MAATLDEVLYELAEEIAATRVDGTFNARVFVGTGLHAAASIVEKKRIELLCKGLVDDAPDT